MDGLESSVAHQLTWVGASQIGDRKYSAHWPQGCYFHGTPAKASSRGAIPPHQNLDATLKGSYARFWD